MLTMMMRKRGGKSNVFVHVGYPPTLPFIKYPPTSPFIKYPPMSGSSACLTRNKCVKIKWERALPKKVTALAKKKSQGKGCPSACQKKEQRQQKIR
jgi:hypothetical protein